MSESLIMWAVTELLGQAPKAVVWRSLPFAFPTE